MTNKLYTGTKIVVFSLLLLLAPIVGAQSSLDEPELTSIVPMLIKIVNLVIIAVGAILVIMIIVGAIKFAMALGDPKMMVGAQLTWTYAAYGLLVIVGAFVLFTTITKMLGIQITPQGINTSIEIGITSFLKASGITPD